jgi:L-threonylcarbamoyladenylate synthase
LFFFSTPSASEVFLHPERERRVSLRAQRALLFHCSIVLSNAFPLTCYLYRVVLCDVNSPSPDAIEKAAQAIRHGQIVLHPTDTLYGLACDPLNPAALHRLFSLKNRSSSKGVLLMIPGSSYGEVFCRSIPQVFYGMASALWPGPVTLLLQAKASLPDLVRGKSGLVGLRQPDLPFLQLWMEAIPGAIVSTSANLSDQSPPSSLAQLRQLLASEVDLYLEGEEIDGQRQASTVVDLTLDPPQVVRSGQWAGRVQDFLNRSTETKK